MIFRDILISLSLAKESLFLARMFSELIPALCIISSSIWIISSYYAKIYI